MNVYQVLLRLDRINGSTKTFKIKGNSGKDAESIEKRPLKDRQNMGDLICGISERSPFLENLHLEQLWFDFGYQRKVSKQIIMTSLNVSNDLFY